MSKGKRWAVLAALEIPNEVEQAWAAGFIEGDGYIGRCLTTVSIEVTQKQEWPLLRLQRFFGGSIGRINKQGISNGSYWRWRISGKNARYCAALIKRHLSPYRLDQLSKWNLT